ncbi:coiled-coil domain-containing protein 55-domain containing protein [Chytriomyces sp. MP71]|nr:coiled-coil domain-containing protein 55-domain containing protein [Chytriomyces sp. MP71]
MQRSLTQPLNQLSPQASNGSLRNVFGAGSGIKFGLIKKGSPTAKKPPVPSSSASSLFEASHADDDDEEDDDADSGDHRTLVNKHLAAQSLATTAKARNTLASALEEDADLFDYDKAFDALKQQKEAQKLLRDNAAEKKPRYVQNLLKASLQRKIELERVEDRKVAREREQEGEMFGDKDAFVTDAYKKRQEELRLLEEEEKRKEALQRTGGEDMTQFYRSLLDAHLQISSSLTPEQLETAAAERERREREKQLEQEEALQDAIQRGEVKINASNEVVDKRVLLKGGLNISRTKVRSLHEEKEYEERERARILAEQRAKEREAERLRREAEALKWRAKEEQARRLVEESQRQKVEGERKRAEEEERIREEVAKRNAKRTTEDAALDARARFLARKKAALDKPDEDSD